RRRHTRFDCDWSSHVCSSDLLSKICSGSGIATDKLEHIFDKFTQADSSTTRKYGGTGLGLAISRQLTELQGGTLLAESQLGKGRSEERRGGKESRAGGAEGQG